MWAARRRDDDSKEKRCPSHDWTGTAVASLPHMLLHNMGKHKELKPPEQGKIDKYSKAMGFPAQIDSRVQPPDTGDLLLAIQQSRTAMETIVDGVAMEVSLLRQELRKVVE
ncbi:hypothetical protein NDU88_005493 [Pleurodeles waltl]|uniref:Uncharacterized protein n=1 Tax=Pleurodeles waltl TaxID=8319 RepID=A0AAV7W801_PLEWA|nr:hypothetical protein NDU88_005493 [Pleurodeles waltl]